jgi:hypothetical protein
MRGTRKLTILGLGAYGLTESQLRRLGKTLVDLEVYSRYSPDIFPNGARFRRLLAQSPEERLAAIRQWRIRQHEKLLGALRSHDREVVQSDGDPVGARVTLPAKDIRRILAGARVEYVEILRIRGMRRKRAARGTPTWFGVKVRFAIQIEGQTKGTQTYEDRIILVLARSSTEAERKAAWESRRFEAPSLCFDGHFYRWSFETVLGTYNLHIAEIGRDGMAVFSELKHRRMKPDYEWNGHESIGKT